MRKKITVHIIFPEVGPINGLTDKIVAITLLATVTVHPGAATVSVPSVHGMKTATLTIAFISVSPFLLKNYLALNNGLQVSRVLILK